MIDEPFWGHYKSAGGIERRCKPKLLLEGLSSTGRVGLDQEGVSMCLHHSHVPGSVVVSLGFMRFLSYLSDTRQEDAPVRSGHISLARGRDVVQDSRRLQQ